MTYFENISFILGCHWVTLPQKKICKSHILKTLSVIARKYAHKNVGQLAAQKFYKGPLMIHNMLRTSPK